jgi:hypothetical protein
LTVSSIYFVVTGIQFWISNYFMSYLKASPTEVYLAYSFTSVTAPTLGVITGLLFAQRRNTDPETGRLYGLRNTQNVPQNCNYVSVFQSSFSVHNRNLCLLCVAMANVVLWVQTVFLYFYYVFNYTLMYFCFFFNYYLNKFFYIFVFFFYFFLYFPKFS